MKRRHFLFGAISTLALAACSKLGIETQSRPSESRSSGREDENIMAGKFEITHTDEEWAQLLDKEAYHVLREKGTEYAFTGIYWNHKEAGVYHCAGCGNPLFASDTKYESGTGWPSFFAPVDSEAVGTATDTALGMKRVEVYCSRCGGHLGHVFDDGPKPTGLRYCLNSVSLAFEPES